MQTNKQTQTRPSITRLLFKITLLGVLTVFTASCVSSQGYYSPEQQNARTNALRAFAEAAHMYNQQNIPVYSPGAPMRPVIIQPQNYQAYPNYNPYVQPQNYNPYPSYPTYP